MKFFEKKQIFLILLFLAVVSCVKDNSKETLFLDKMEGIVWTRGRNFKSFESNPFKLFIVEDGICIEFK
jgi:hypothetical protein